MLWQQMFDFFMRGTFVKGSLGHGEPANLVGLVEDVRSHDFIQLNVLCELYN